MMGVPMGMIEKRVDEQSGLTSYTGIGEISGADVLKEVQKFYSGKMTKNVLWDLSGADLRQITSSEIYSIAKLPREHFEERRGGKTAIVVSSDFSFGLTRMYELQTNAEEQPFETDVFRTLEAAHAWLNGPEEENQ